MSQYIENLISRRGADGSIYAWAASALGVVAAADHLIEAATLTDGPHGLVWTEDVERLMRGLQVALELFNEIDGDE